LSKEERKEVYGFIDKQLRKEYIMPSKSPQMALVFFVKKKMVRRECFRTIGT